MVIELSEYGFQALSRTPLPLNTWGEASIQLGKSEQSVIKVMAVWDKIDGATGAYGFKVAQPDLPWKKFVNAMQWGATHDDLDNATRFLTT